MVLVWEATKQLTKQDEIPANLDLNRASDGEKTKGCVFVRFLD